MTQSKSAPGKSRPRAPSTQKSEVLQHRYQLGQWVAERRPDGWYVARAWSTLTGEKPRWEGPFPFPQEAAIAIARHLCAELSNRHMARARFHQIHFGNPLYGLPPEPDLSPKRKNGRVP